MHFIDRANAGIYVEPENITDFKDAVIALADNEIQRKSLGKNGRKYVTDHFNRNQIAQDFLHQLENL
jgi:glycosyltransferase involved in cell wall biosynthesis